MSNTSRPAASDNGSDPVIVTAVFTPRPGQLEALRAALISAIPAVHREEGCLLYAIHDASDGTITMIEKWSSAGALASHAEGPAIRALQQAVDGLLTTAAVVTTMTAIPAGDRRGIL